MDPLWDVVVVGAGPAGASAALSALHTRPDARVLLLDRADFPRDKACGDGIAPHALDVLASVGVVGIEAEYAGVDRLRIGFANGPAVDGVMARAAYVIPREVFDARLVQAAVQRGAELWRHRVRTVTAAADGGQLVIDGEIRAHVVIAADGASSVIRRTLAPPLVRATTWPPDWPLLWRFAWKPPGFGSGGRHTAVAIRGYAPESARHAGEQVIVFADPNHDGRSGRSDRMGQAGSSGRSSGSGLSSGSVRSHAQFCEARSGGSGSRSTTDGRPGWPAYAWSFPIGDGRANIGYGELLRTGRPLTRAHLLGRLEELLPGAGVGAQSWRAHLLPLSTGRPRQPDGHILFAGDAMNLINPITGEGIFYAVASGVLAGGAALGGGDPGRTYRTRLGRLLGWHFRHTDAATLLARSPAVVAAAVRAADGNPAVFDDLVELGLGDGKLTPSALAGIATALLPSRGRP